MPSLLRLSTRQKVTIARLLNRCVKLGRAAVGRPMHGQFRRGGLNWHLDLNEGIDFAIYLLGAFERDLLQTYQRLIQPGSTVLDIGANIGAHTLPLAKHVGPNGRVIAIEATDYAYAKLQKNLSLNPVLAAQTTLTQALLTASDNAPTETEIQSSWPLVDGEKTHDMTCGAAKSTAGAKTCTLDTLLSELSLQRVDWIKLDVDGHEITVLQGARKCLETYKPTIFMELAPYCYKDSSSDFADMVEILTSRGYDLFRLPSLTLLPHGAGLLVKNEIPAEGSINILAKPRTKQFS